MPLTILSDADVRTLLLNLTKDDVIEMQQSLADALHYYSTSTEGDNNGCCSSYQPLRTALKRNDGQTTLFMPASSNEGIGVKIVTLADTDKSLKKSVASLSSFSSLSLESSMSTGSSATAFDPPETFDPPESVDSRQSTTPKGSLTLLDRYGNTRALINAEEITAFRTALASTMLFKKRTNVHDLVVFGAGKQAYWHIRLALILRGPEIHHLNIINRTFESAHNLVEKLYNPLDEPAIFPKINIPTAETTHLARPKIQILTPNHTEYDRLLKSTVRGSSVIFCTTPSLTPLFPAGHLTNPEGRKKGRYISAIGSYKPHMVEIHPDIIRQNVQPHHTHHHHKHARQGGAIIVDSVDACLKEAGEIIQAGLTGREVVEVGELVMLKRDAERRRVEVRSATTSSSVPSLASSQTPLSTDSSTPLSPFAPTLDSAGVELGEAKKVKGKQKDKKEGKAEKEADEGLMEWLQKGNVIYKSVGLGLMDVVVGTELVRLADERGVGTRIENF
ncbi:NAD(P)-binding protein [Amniculicola lignicola CBS 123094]|uniref:NAD(P)-binding protein n=1 Tax=Amniculicola lignicola CBS 123094 TaxID=1392246 RepID=A0A6A5W8Q6_9PLEO|nr:NAD(P)-binding protein [Amniculicola lignicola CBS 123094]